MKISVKHFLLSSFFLAVAMPTTSSSAFAAPTAIANSCEGLCGAAGPQGDCWCDEDCTGFGDCCVDYQAQCAGTVKCDNNFDCAAGEFCDFALSDACGSIEQGICRSTPDFCPSDSEPVCGCDGHTYHSKCSANEAGVSVDYVGICPPKLCDQYDEEIRYCGDDEYCMIRDSRGSCGWSDAQGICWLRPASCFPEFNPVCGCDGEVYRSPCLAKLGGVPVAYDEPCSDDAGFVGGRCGGEDGIECQQNLYCKPDEGSACSESKPAGTCIRKYRKCPPIAEPVCGCDGKTYYSSCVADNARVAIASKGECPEPEKPQRCDGPYSANRCAPGQYCEYAEGDTCGRGRAPAECVLATQKCPGLNEPVCGCDGQTYSSSCVAHRRGVSVLKDGPC